MRTNNLLFSLLIAAGVLLTPIAGQADSRVSVGIAFGPPAPPVVVAPPPQPGYVWAPGYYGWNGYQYVWVRGYWMAERPGFVWVSDRWERRGPHWHHVHGYWRNNGHGGHGHGRGHR